MKNGKDERSIIVFGEPVRRSLFQISQNVIIATVIFLIIGTGLFIVTQLTLPDDSQSSIVAQFATTTPIPPTDTPFPTDIPPPTAIPTTTSVRPTTVLPTNNNANCTPTTRFSVGLTAIVDTHSRNGTSSRIAAWTQPGGGIHNSDAEPGMRLSIVGGPECVYNSEYRQFVRYWQVEFTNRNGRYVTGDAWVGEAILEGNYVNYLICPTSSPDC